MKDPIIILHGWGISGNRYTRLQKIFEEKGYVVFTPDFPGFGDTKLPKSQLNLDDYVHFLKNFYTKNHIKKAILIGHSFGGRVAAKYTGLYPKSVSKLILTGAPLIKKPLSFSKKILSLVSGFGKKFIPGQSKELTRKILYRILGEWDYYKSGNMKETLINILNEDVSPVLPTILVPTLLLWGENDTFVPLTIGKEIAERINNASVVTIKGATHKLPYENPDIFAKKVLAFIQ